MNKNNKQLMFAMSKSLTKSEAYSFAKTMNGGDKYYIYKVSENPNARDAFRRESWVVVRDLRANEVVPQGYGLFAEKNQLIPM